jgi:hypothetical protein
MGHGIRTVTWNHGKILAVNGEFLMTGGGNYWDAYRASDLKSPGYIGQKSIYHNIIGCQAIVMGEAAISAHC